MPLPSCHQAILFFTPSRFKIAMERWLENNQGESESLVHQNALDDENTPNIESYTDPRDFADYPYRLPRKFEKIKDDDLRVAAKSILGLNHSCLIPSVALSLLTAGSYWMVASKEDVSILASALTTFVNFIFYLALYPDWIASVQDTFKMLPILIASQRKDLKSKNYACLRAFARLLFLAIHASIYVAFFIIAATNALPILLALLRERKTGEIHCLLQSGDFSVTENGLSPCWTNQFASIMLIFGEGVTAAPEIIAMIWTALFLFYFPSWLNTKTVENRQYIVGKFAVLAQLYNQKDKLEAALKKYEDEEIEFDLNLLADPLCLHQDDGLEALIMVAATRSYVLSIDHGKSKKHPILQALRFINYIIFGYGGSLLLNLSFGSAGFVALSQALPQLGVDLLGKNLISSALFAILQVHALVQLLIVITAILPDIFLLGKLTANFFPNLYDSIQNIREKKSHLKKLRDFIVLAGVLTACMFSTVGLTAGTNESITIANMDPANSTIIHNPYLDPLTRALFGTKISAENPLSHELYVGTLITIIVGTALNAYTFLKLWNALEEKFRRAMQYFPMVSRPVHKAKDNTILASKLLLDLYDHLIQIMQSPFFQFHSLSELKLPLPTKEERKSNVDSASFNTAGDGFDDNMTASLAHISQNSATAIPLDQHSKNLVKLILWTLAKEKGQDDSTDHTAPSTPNHAAPHNLYGNSHVVYLDDDYQAAPTGNRFKMSSGDWHSEPVAYSEC